jgi:hypothetical protein
VVIIVFSHVLKISGYRAGRQEFMLYGRQLL